MRIIQIIQPSKIKGRKVRSASAAGKLIDFTENYQESMQQDAENMNRTC